MNEKLLNNLERRFGKFAIHDITKHIIILQVIVFILVNMKQISYFDLFLNGSLVYSGQVWRILTYIGIPPSLNPLWAFFAWSLFYTYGTALENKWGTFKYNFYLIIGFIVTTVTALVFPGFVFDSSLFTMTSAMFAFSIFYPYYKINVMLILPIEIRWISLFTAAILILNLFSAEMNTKVMILAGTANFLLFFWKDFLNLLKRNHRRRTYEKKEKKAEEAAFHTCHECTITDTTHPDMTFRYCGKCGEGFCEEHIGNHKCKSD